MADAQSWELERSAPVRADADGVFVPLGELPDAVVGDRVILFDHSGGVDREGTIVAVAEHDGVPFHRIGLDELDTVRHGKESSCHAADVAE